MMPSFVFLLGRPGCGKSLIYKKLSAKLSERGLEVTRIDDFPILKELLDRDKEFKRHYRKEGGFVVTDFTLLDDVLKEINQRLKREAREDKVIFVEFARDRYLEALRNFDADVLRRSLLLYIYCPFDVCVQRNVRRFREGGGKTLDDHIAPSDIMEQYYRYDDMEELYLRSEEELRSRAPAELVVVRNEVDDEARLDRELERVLERFQR